MLPEWHSCAGHWLICLVTPSSERMSTWASFRPHNGRFGLRHCYVRWMVKDIRCSLYAWTHWRRVWLLHGLVDWYDVMEARQIFGKPSFVKIRTYSNCHRSPPAYFRWLGEHKSTKWNHRTQRSLQLRRIARRSGTGRRRWRRVCRGTKWPRSARRICWGGKRLIRGRPMITVFFLHTCEFKFCIFYISEKRAFLVAPFDVWHSLIQGTQVTYLRLIVEIL